MEQLKQDIRTAIEQGTLLQRYDVLKLQAAELGHSEEELKFIIDSISAAMKSAETKVEEPEVKIEEPEVKVEEPEVKVEEAEVKVEEAEAKAEKVTAEPEPLATTLTEADKQEITSHKKSILIAILACLVVDLFLPIGWIAKLVVAVVAAFAIVMISSFILARKIKK